MSNLKREKQKVYFIESYWTGGEYGSDYQWNDNHGELIRCGNCKHWRPTILSDDKCGVCAIHPSLATSNEWYCGSALKKDDEE